MLIRWTTCFLDTPRDAPRAAAALDFWRAVTGTHLSPRRGEQREFLTLVPPDADAVLRWQDTGPGPAGTHLDLHVDDVASAAAEARDAGAAPVADLGDVFVLRSPAGCVFCLVPHAGESRRPSPVAGAGGSTSLVDQLCLDVPAPAFEAEVDWWSGLTGWPRSPREDAEFVALDRPAGMPLRLLLQRLGDDDPRPAATSHLDVSSTGREDVVRRHLALGARLEHGGRGWTTLADPVGRPYCVTDRRPVDRA